MNLTEYPGFLDDKVRQFPFAASRALNDTAYQMRKDLISGAEGDLDFRVSARRALGIGVDQSTKHNLHAVVSTSRPWLTHQVQKGVTRPVRGIKYAGRSYLLIPNPSTKRTRKKGFGRVRRFTTGRGGRIFIINPRGGNPVLMLRYGDDADEIQPLGVLVPEAQYADDYDWTGHSKDTINQVMGKNFKKNLAKAMASRRR